MGLDAAFWTPIADEFGNCESSADPEAFAGEFGMVAL
jgi:hypothetical protein